MCLIVVHHFFRHENVKLEKVMIVGRVMDAANQNANKANFFKMESLPSLLERNGDRETYIDCVKVSMWTQGNLCLPQVDLFSGMETILLADWLSEGVLDNVGQLVVRISLDIVKKQVTGCLLITLTLCLCLCLCLCLLNRCH